MQRLGLANLDWLVVRDLSMIESATFWKDGPEVETGEMTTEDIGTEVFFLPAAAHTEKSGRFTNTQRMLQWHHKAVRATRRRPQRPVVLLPPRPDHPQKLAGSTDERDRPLLDLTWDYPAEGRYGDPVADAVLARDQRHRRRTARAAVGVHRAEGRRIDRGAGAGSTAAVYADGVNQPARRKPGGEQSWVAPEWGWAWPANRRILYNRASADPDGKPWSERKAYVWWDADEGSGPGTTSLTSSRTSAPTIVPAEGRQGRGRHRRR